MSTRGSTGQQKRMKARRKEKRGKKEDGSTRRTTTRNAGKDMLTVARKRNTLEELMR